MNPRLIGSSKLICDLICGKEVHADVDKGKTNDSRLSLRFEKIWGLVATMWGEKKNHSFKSLYLESGLKAKFTKCTKNFEALESFPE